MSTATEGPNFALFDDPSRCHRKKTDSDQGNKNFHGGRIHHIHLSEYERT